MIRRSQKTGRYFCDGHDCGTDLRWFAGDPDDGCDGQWVCMDCNDSVCEMRDSIPHQISERGTARNAEAA